MHNTAAPRQPGASLLRGESRRQWCRSGFSRLEGGRRWVVAVGKVVDEPVDGFFNPYPVGVIERSPIDVELSQREPLDRDFVVIDRQRFVLEERFGFMRGLVGIVCQHALVEALLRRQRRLVAEQHLEELQMLDMPPQHNQAHGQRRRQQQPDRSPKQSPKSGGDQHRDAGKARAVAIEPGLDHVAGDELDGEEQTDDPEQHRPSRIDGDSDAAGNAAAMIGPI